MKQSVGACLLLVFFLVAVAEAASAKAKAGSEAGANPIRRIVTMLQMMQNKVEAEGEKQKELYEKFACYCETQRGSLGKSIEDATEKIPQLESAIKSGIGAKAQLEADLAEHKATRKDAQKTMEESTAMREKEFKAFTAESSEQKANIDALSKAIPAIEKGMGSSFLQTDDGAKLRRIFAQASQSLTLDDRDAITAFLTQRSASSAAYEPASGEILGILKQQKEDMEKDLKEMIDEEASAKTSYDELMAAKTEEVSAASAAIEEKTARLGEVAVEIVENKNDLEGTSEQFDEDKKFLAEIEKECAVRAKEFEAAQKTSAMEMAALSDTIKLLNDDDALDLFKKTLPGASAAAAASFLQTGTSTASGVRERALSFLQSARHGKRGGLPRVNLDFIALALRGKAAGFGKVLKMIDDMSALLKKEGKDDEEKKEYCEAKFDQNEDEIKATNIKIGDLNAKIDEAKESMASVQDEVKALEDGIVELDRSVVAATNQRKEENAEYTEMLAANNAAIQLIEMAKNRMNKFYNPKMYKAPPKRELTEEQRITQNMGGTLAPTAPPGGIAGTGISALEISEDDSSYRKQAEASNGVIAMMDMMIQDVKTEVQEAKHEETTSQADYEEMMATAKEKRAQDSKAITEKKGVVAELEAKIQELEGARDAESDKALAHQEVKQNLHKDCDWLLQNFDARKTAREDEIESLAKAKSVLSSGGASSFVQVGVHTHRMRGSAAPRQQN